MCTNAFMIIWFDLIKDCKCMDQHSHHVIAIRKQFGIILCLFLSCFFKFQYFFPVRLCLLVERFCKVCVNILSRYELSACLAFIILRNVNTPTLRLGILTFLVELLPEGYPNIYVGEEFICNIKFSNLHDVATSMTS